MKLAMWLTECMAAVMVPIMPIHWWKLMASSKGITQFRGVDLHTILLVACCLHCHVLWEILMQC